MCVKDLKTLYIYSLSSPISSVHVHHLLTRRLVVRTLADNWTRELIFAVVVQRLYQCRIIMQKVVRRVESSAECTICWWLNED